MTNPLAFIAIGIIGVGIPIILYRIKREADMERRGEITWIAYSDWLVIASIILSTLFTIPLAILPVNLKGILGRILIASSITSLLLLLGYIFGILAHYRLIFGRNRKGPRENPEPVEKIIVDIFWFLAIIFFLLIILL